MDGCIPPPGLRPSTRALCAHAVRDCGTPGRGRAGAKRHTIRALAADGATVLLTTQYLDEAEQLADRIAILHEGRIIVDGTLDELRRLLPAATVEYVERQPTLEEVFLAVVGAEQNGTASHGIAQHDAVQKGAGS